MYYLHTMLVLVRPQRFPTAHLASCQIYTVVKKFKANTYLNKFELKKYEDDINIPVQMYVHR